MKPMSGCTLIGASRVLSGIQDAVVLQHSVVGCHWGSLAAGMLQQSDNFRQASTVVYEENVIRGGTELIPQGLDNIAELYPDVRTVFVVSGCIPNMIGDDMQSTVEHWQETHPDYRVLHIPTPGYGGNEGEGMERAWLSLLDLIKLNGKNEESTGEVAESALNNHSADCISGSLPKVNLLGITASDPYSINDLKYLRKVFEGKIEIVCALQQCTTKDIARMGQADLNLVFGRGDKLAKAMEEQFGIPYLICEYPYGIQGMKSFFCELGKRLKADFSEAISQIDTEADRLVKRSAMYLTTLYQLPAAVTGDKAHLSGMKRFLEDELGMEAVLALDADTSDQNRLEERLQETHTVLLMGSSFEAVLADTLSLPLVRYVYPVVDEVCLTAQPLLGPEGTAYLIQQIVNAAMQMRYKTDGVYRGLREK